MKRLYKHRWIYTALVSYIILFSGWWTHLLYTKTETEYQLRHLVSRYEMLSGIAPEMATERTLSGDEDVQLKSKHNRQRLMIFGESVVFFVLLIVGMFALNRSFKKELALAKQQRNFLLSITHELKSPIASIQLAFETFLKRDLQKKQIDQLSANTMREVHRLNDLVNNILMAARLESTEFEFAKDELDMGYLAAQILENMETKFPQTHFILNLQPSATETEELHHIVFADYNAMTSVLTNLIENAVKYCPKNCEVQVNIYQQNQQLIVEVADKGIGIPDAEKQRIFNKFYRIGNEDTRTTKGTGLGLYLVKTLVKAHQGNISVHDNNPQGAIFRVSLPLMQFAPPHTAPATM